MTADLTETSAYQHLQHWLGEARDAARLCISDFRALAKFVGALKNALEAMRGIALLRSDERWLGYAKALQPLIDQAMSSGRPTTGDLRWFRIAEKLDQVSMLAERQFQRSVH